MDNVYHFKHYKFVNCICAYFLITGRNIQKNKKFFIDNNRKTKFHKKK